MECLRCLDDSPRWRRGESTRRAAGWAALSVRTVLELTTATSRAGNKLPTRDRDSRRIGLLGKLDGILQLVQRNDLEQSFRRGLVEGLFELLVCLPGFYCFRTWPSETLATENGQGSRMK